MLIFRLSVLVGIAALLGVQRPAAKELDARQILERTDKVYAQCKTYRDSGVVQTLFIQERRNWTVRKPFTTAFVRPDRFRYEFKNRRGEYEFDRYLVWMKGEDVRRWWDIRPGVAKENNLERALSAPGGVSGGSSCTISDLLLDFRGGSRRATDPTTAARKADKDLDGSRCFVIERGGHDEPMTLWIDQKTFLLRRIDEQKTFGDFRTEATTTYEPVVDAEIPEALLVFDPPEAAQDAPGLPAARRFQAWAPEEPEAPEILARMAKVYAECKSYRDSGVVMSVTIQDGGRKSTDKLPFTTAFVRPARFRYEVKCRRGEYEFDRCLVWRNDQDVCTWSDEGIERPTFLLAWPAATLKTDFCATTIPTLLVPDEMSPEVPLTSLTDLERLQDDELEGAPCFVVQGDRWSGRSLTLWIDRKSFLLRKTLTLTQDILRTETTTTYEPAIDEEIPESLLVFDPPVPEER